MNKAGQTDLGEKATHKLGWAYFKRNDFERAAKTFEAQLSQYPRGESHADGLFMFAECLFQQALYESALDAFDKALDAKSSSPEFRAQSLLHAGQSAAQLKQWDRSLKLLQTLISEQPDTPHRDESLYEQGYAQQNLGKLDEALKLYTAVAETPQDSILNARARFMMGEVLFEQRKHEEAVRNFFKVAYGYGDTKAPQKFHVWQANALYEAARCLEVLKKPEQAKKSYGELIERFPNSDKTPRAKERIAAVGK
jgi:TolA-binding protein